MPPGKHDVFQSFVDVCRFRSRGFEEGAFVQDDEER